MLDCWPLQQFHSLPITIDHQGRVIFQERVISGSSLVKRAFGKPYALCIICASNFSGRPDGLAHPLGVALVQRDAHSEAPAANRIEETG